MKFIKNICLLDINCILSRDRNDEFQNPIFKLKKCVTNFWFGKTVTKRGVWNGFKNIFRNFQIIWSFLSKVMIQRESCSKWFQEYLLKNWDHLIISVKIYDEIRYKRNGSRLMALVTGLRECVLIFVTTFVSNILLYLQYCPSFELARTEQNSPGLCILRLNDDLYIEFESCMRMSRGNSHFCKTAKINKMRIL